MKLEKPAIQFPTWKRGKGTVRDLTGLKIGYLTVLENTGKRDKWGSVIWKCRCDFNGCGNIVEIGSSNLVSGRVVSCGCYRKSANAQIHAKDITGQRFGKLVALYPTTKRAGSFVIWHCKCDCGKEKDISIGHLMRW